jgi:hypothetical protein
VSRSGVAVVTGRSCPENRQEANMTKLTTRKPTSTRLTETQLIVLSGAVQR